MPTADHHMRVFELATSIAMTHSEEDPDVFIEAAIMAALVQTEAALQIDQYQGLHKIAEVLATVRADLGKTDPTITELFANNAKNDHFPDAGKMGTTPAFRDVWNERIRQITVKNFSSGHDDKHLPGTLCAAAACYALESSKQGDGIFSEATGDRADEAIADLWPWSEEWWKPKTRRENLIRAGALIIAEIERLDRAAAAEGGDA